MTTVKDPMKVFPDVEALSHAAAEAVVDRLRAAAEERGRCSLVLAGGSTPVPLYRLLAGPFAGRAPWDLMHIFWGDERFVPHDHPESNFGSAEEALLRHVPVPRGQVHPIPAGSETPELAARRYEDLLRQFFEGDRKAGFDVLLLGMGADGHTASLFPGRPLGGPRLVEAVQAPAEYRTGRRVTLTVDALNRARHVFFLVAGREKSDALRAVRAGAGDEGRLPAAHIRGLEETVWFVDEDAADGGGTTAVQAAPV